MSIRAQSSLKRQVLKPLEITAFVVLALVATLSLADHLLSFPALVSRAKSIVWQRTAGRSGAAGW